MIERRVEPRVVKTWEVFCKDAPPFSVALDGYVIGAPRYDPSGPRLNINHHEEVDRLSTRSTTSQVYMLIKQGLFECFRERGEPRAMLWENDPDPDTATADWLMFHYDRILGTKSEPLISRLVFAEDMLDATAGAYPFDPDSKIMRELAWIYAPFVEARISGQLTNMNGGGMETIIEAVGARISEYTLGRGKEIPLDMEYDVLVAGRGWQMIVEKGYYARTKLYNKGTRAFVSVRERVDGTYAYTLGKMSPFIPFPITELYDEVNKLEGIAPNDRDRWGGGNTIGGSPRQKGSKIPPRELAVVIDTFIRTRLQT